MKNERQIMPLRRYEVSFNNMDEPVAFTADDMEYNAETYTFYSAGNTIRVIAAYLVEQVVVSPVEEA